MMDTMGPTIACGDCRVLMKRLPENSVDAIVTDPPYGLEFLGKEWDKLGWQGGGGFSKPGIGERPTEWTSFSATSRFGAANPTCAMCGGRLRGAKKCSCEQPHDHWKPIGKRRNPENEGLPDDMTGGGMGRQMAGMQAWHFVWAVEALRVLKPGGHALVFGGTRTHHRLMCALEDAGFEIRDTMLYWGYGSGFPKSLNVSRVLTQLIDNSMLEARYQGLGTALKPAYEPVVVARKPLSESTVAGNVLRWGVGGINIDATRIQTRENLTGGAYAGGTRPTSAMGCEGDAGGKNSFLEAGTPRLSPEDFRQPSGRWPANLVLGHSPGCRLVGTRKVKSDGHHSGKVPEGGGLYELGLKPLPDRGNIYADEDGFETVEAWDCVADCPVRMLDEQSGNLGNNYRPSKAQGHTSIFGSGNYARTLNQISDSGASRFFYCAKADQGERFFYCAECRDVFPMDCWEGHFHGKPRGELGHLVSHPTQKPLDLVKYLVRLVAPKGGLVLDPFLGTGTTAVACRLLGFAFTGFDVSEEYCRIARKRLAVIPKDLASFGQ